MAGHQPPLLIHRILETALERFPEQRIVYRDRKEFTYRAFGERVRRLGSGLASLGARPGTVVAVMGWDCHRYLECFFAVPMSACVLMTVNVRLSPEQITYTLNHSEAELLFCHADFMPILEQIKPHLTRLRQVICINEEGAAPVEFGCDGEYESLLASGDPGHDFPEFDENTRATTFYTTGTTGLPKGVFYAHRQIVLHTLISSSSVNFSPSDVYMPITPMFHVHAWGMPFNAMFRGLKQVYPGRYAPDLLARLFREHRVTFSHCVPTVLRMFLDATRGEDLRGWRAVIGGSALSRALCREALERGADVFSGYGMSETGPLATLALVKPELRDGGETEITTRCRAGMPMPMVQLRIVDESMRDVPRDGASTGEVVLRSPWLTEGYLGDEAASAALWRGGWLHTGDIGRLDEHGYLIITDRMKDVVKTGGEWVSSLQIEDILAEHPDVAEAAVIAVQDKKWGERPLALVVARTPALDAESLRQQVMRHVETGEISKYAIPERIEFVEALPRTSVGKLDKKLLRARFAG